MSEIQHISDVILEVLDRVSLPMITKKKASEILGVHTNTIYNKRHELGAKVRGKKYEYPIKNLIHMAMVKQIEKTNAFTRDYINARCAELENEKQKIISEYHLGKVSLTKNELLKIIQNYDRQIQAIDKSI